MRAVVGVGLGFQGVGGWVGEVVDFCGDGIEGVGEGLAGVVEMVSGGDGGGCFTAWEGKGREGLGNRA